jgi:tetratricopeptide (TPR) repeat protein
MSSFRFNRRFFSLCFLLLFSLFSFVACSNPEQQKAEHVRRGEQLLEERKFQEASIEFRSAIQIDEQLAQAHWGLARAYEGLQRFREVFDELRRTIQLDPGNLEARQKLGNYLLLVKPPRLDDAEEQAREILQRDPNFIEGHILRASIFALRNQPQEALAALNRAIEINPGRVESYLSLARFFEQRGEADRAGEAYRRAISVNDRSGLAHAEYGKYLVRQNRPDQAEAEFLRAVEVEPQNRDVRFVLASFYLVNNRLDRAEEAYRALAELDRDRPEGRAVLADFYATVGRYADALNIYREINQNAPDYTRGRYRLTEILLQSGDREAASREISTVLQANERDTQALLLRARIRLQNDEVNPAIEDLRRVLDLEPNSLAGLYFMTEANLRAGQIEQARVFVGDLERFYPNYLPAKLLQVQVNLAGRDPASALRLANDLIARLQTATPDAQTTPQMLVELRTKALTARGTVHAALNNLSAARADMEAARNSAPGDASTHVNVARVAAQENKPDEALQNFNRALEINRTNFDALSGLINIHGPRGQIGEAHARIDAALAQQPNSAALHFLKGQAFAFGEPQRAEAEFTRAIELDQNYVPAYFALSGLYINTNQHDRAIERYRQVAERRPSDPVAFTMMGLVEESRQNRQAAAENFQRAIQNDQNLGTAAGIIAANNIAWMAAEHGHGNLDEAMRLAQTVVQRYPQEPGFADTLGWVYYKKGLFGPAVEQLRKAANFSANRGRDNAGYRYRLGLALIGSGDRAGARRELEQAVRLGQQQNFEQLEEARRALQTL